MNKKCIVLCLVASILTGCISSGNKTISQLNSSQVNTMIHDGATTKMQVRAKFGDPSKIDLNNDGTEKWTYQYTKSTVKPISFIPLVSWFRSGTDDLSRELVVLFDNKQLVKKHAFAAAKGETLVGLAA